MMLISNIWRECFKELVATIGSKRKELCDVNTSGCRSENCSLTLA